MPNRCAQSMCVASAGPWLIAAVAGLRFVRQSLLLPSGCTPRAARTRRHSANSGAFFASFEAIEDAPGQVPRLRRLQVVHTTRRGQLADRRSIDLPHVSDQFEDGETFLSGRTPVVRGHACVVPDLPVAVAMPGLRQASTVATASAAFAPAVADVGRSKLSQSHSVASPPRATRAATARISWNPILNLSEDVTGAS